MNQELSESQLIEIGETLARLVQDEKFKALLVAVDLTAQDSIRPTNLDDPAFERKLIYARGFQESFAKLDQKIGALIEQASMLRAKKAANAPKETR